MARLRRRRRISTTKRVRQGVLGRFSQHLAHRAREHLRAKPMPRALAGIAAAGLTRGLLYQLAHRPDDEQDPAAGTTGVCELKVVVPNTVIADVTTCS